MLKLIDVISFLKLSLTLKKDIGYAVYFMDLKESLGFVSVNQIKNTDKK